MFTLKRATVAEMRIGCFQAGYCVVGEHETEEGCTIHYVLKDPRTHTPKVWAEKYGAEDLAMMAEGALCHQDNWQYLGTK